MGDRLQRTNQTTLGINQSTEGPPPLFVFNVPSLSLKLNTAGAHLTLDILKSSPTWTPACDQCELDPATPPTHVLGSSKDLHSLAALLSDVL